jgi:hypothetical protein
MIMPGRGRGLLLLTCLVVACKSSETAQRGPESGVSAVQFQDLVVPDGMRIQETNHESHSREEQGWRFGHFVYSGQPKVEDACAHLLLRMPQHQWRLVQDQQESTTARRLRFARGRYSAEYRLDRQDGVTQMTIEYRTEIEQK